MACVASFDFLIWCFISRPSRFFQIKTIHLHFSIQSWNGYVKSIFLKLNKRRIPEDRWSISVYGILRCNRMLRSLTGGWECRSRICRARYCMRLFCINRNRPQNKWTDYFCAEPFIEWSVWNITRIIRTDMCFAVRRLSDKKDKQGVDCGKLLLCRQERGRKTVRLMNLRMNDGPVSLKFCWNRSSHKEFTSQRGWILFA